VLGDLTKEPRLMYGFGYEAIDAGFGRGGSAAARGRQHEHGELAGGWIGSNDVRQVGAG
jgi:hypothetical protein